MSGNFVRMLSVVPADRALRLVPAAAAADANEAPTDAEVIAELRRENHGLHEAMKSRATIEQAEGMVMRCYGLSPEQAFALLVHWSSSWNVKLRRVAEALARLALRVLVRAVGADSPARSFWRTATDLMHSSRLEELPGDSIRPESQRRWLATSADPARTSALGRWADSRD